MRIGKWVILTRGELCSVYDQIIEAMRSYERWRSFGEDDPEARRMREEALFDALVLIKKRVERWL
jgi:hypothetical protein